ncbi:hypothetical protein PAECIP111893_02429 [Paenibacillus plantiphilus]|uniref:DNA-binding protein n=1 Tax=Paenibacillus plantiphilus TaxID=2905650 RepID=A0ABM9C8C3_9BACL|nr:DNA-binding protein [Paenibacillus plantiphilus]CAH1205820.1 hypothetical protein PAECIP111893_02429 [Paenibacillus plantiphilus]
MLKVEIDYDQIAHLINAAVDSALERHSMANNLPPILSKTQFMDLLDIGPTKAGELLNREDFPVIRELGHPKVLTHLFLQWCEEHTDWISKNSGSETVKRKGPPDLRRAK